jgi:hypothetical protein
MKAGVEQIHQLVFEYCNSFGRDGYPGFSVEGDGRFLVQDNLAYQYSLFIRAPRIDLWSERVRWLTNGHSLLIEVPRVKSRAFNLRGNLSGLSVIAENDEFGMP